MNIKDWSSPESRRTFWIKPRQPASLPPARSPPPPPPFSFPTKTSSKTEEEKLKVKKEMVSSVPAGPARLTHKHRSRRGSKAVTERREPPVLRPPAEMSEAPAAGGVGHDLRPGGTCAQHRDPAREQPRICRRVLGLPQRTTANGGLKRETYLLPALEVGSPTLTPALKAQGRLCPGPALKI